MQLTKYALTLAGFSLLILACLPLQPAAADSVNSPNVTMNVDLNRSAGNGAGNTAVAVNTVTVAETTLPEYSSGAGKAITLKARPGFQFDPTSSVSAVSTTIGLNGSAINTAASLTPTGSANEVLTFNLTSGTSATVQDIVRISGIKLKILTAAGAVGPAQTTIGLTTSTAGGAFNDQGIVAASIAKGAADRLIFTTQPGGTQAATPITAELRLVDFGGNTVTNDARGVTLSLSTNPGSATLNGTTNLTTANGIATWSASQNLNITIANTGYVLRATSNGANLLTTNSVDSVPFAILPGAPGSISITSQPTTGVAGASINIAARVLDEFGNPTTVNDLPITVDATTAGGWPLLTDSSLTKLTANGLVSWDNTDNLRVLKAVSNYKLSLSGLGTPAETTPFNILPGTAALLRYVQQPTNVIQGEDFDPAITVETTDEFGNRADTSDAVSLSLNSAKCKGRLFGNSALSSSGLASFLSSSAEKPCATAILTATAEGLVGATSDTFRISATDETTVAVRSLELKRNKLIRFNSSGSFPVSTAAKDNPTKNGATLKLKGSTGSVTIKLGKSGWKKAGSSTFRFKGSKCDSVVISKRSISALCKTKTGSIRIPESEIALTLSVGKGTVKYCGLCGGTDSGDQSNKFKRKDCARPTVCQ